MTTQRIDLTISLVFTKSISLAISAVQKLKNQEIILCLNCSVQGSYRELF
jgi:hypothetical protein